MENISQNFRLAVNTDKETVIRILKNNFNELKDLARDTTRFMFGENYVTIAQNDDFNLNLSLTDEDGFLYYQNNLDFIPTSSHITLGKQISLSKEIADTFMRNSIRAEIIAEFEDLL